MVKKWLSDRIYKTKKNRIMLEERLISTNKFYQVLIIYYSLVIVSFSILALIKPIEWINYVLILSSISITVISVYLSSENYIKRANEIKSNYTKIAELEIQNELLIDDQLTADNLNAINCEYQELLRQVENHKTIDYEKAMGIKSLNYWMNIIKTFLFRGVLIIVPMICLIFYLCQTF